MPDVIAYLKKAVTVGASDILIISGMPVSLRCNGVILAEDEDNVMPDTANALVEMLYELAGRGGGDRAHRYSPSRRVTPTQDASAPSSPSSTAMTDATRRASCWAAIADAVAALASENTLLSAADAVL